MSELNISPDRHDAVLLGSDNREMIEVWSALVVDIDDRTMTVFGMDGGRKVADVAPVIAYAHVARAAYALASAATVVSGDFDPVLFGQRCAMIAREQIDRCRRGQN